MGYPFLLKDAANPSAPMRIMVVDFDGFDWSNGNVAKCMKHGVSVGEIESVFWGVPRIWLDHDHSFEEERFIGVGRAGSGRWIFLVFCWRNGRNGEKLARPISARYMHAHEIRRYETVADPHQ